MHRVRTIVKKIWYCIFIFLLDCKIFVVLHMPDLQRFACFQSDPSLLLVTRCNSRSFLATLEHLLGMFKFCTFSFTPVQLALFGVWIEVSLHLVRSKLFKGSLQLRWPIILECVPETGRVGIYCCARLCCRPAWHLRLLAFLRRRTAVIWEIMRAVCHVVWFMQQGPLLPRLLSPCNHRVLPTRCPLVALTFRCVYKCGNLFCK